MPFVKMPGVTGKVYVPEANAGQPKKHPCPDCFACQQCGNERCTVCRAEASKDVSRRRDPPAGSAPESQCHHHCQRQQQKDKQAFK